jgi:all-trans-retinol dehydrogenase (NAD+)
MQRLQKGHIVALSSVAGLSESTSRGTRITLSTAQFAVQGFAESLYTEFRHSNSNIMISLVHIYPFIIEAEVATDIRFRYFKYFI